MMAIALLLLIGLILLQNRRTPGPVGDARSFSTLYLCGSTTKTQCNANVMEFDYTLITRQEFFVVSRDFPPDEALDVVLQDITIKFTDPVDETETPGTRMLIYLDSDGNGVLDESTDTKLASATIRGRRIKFENLNLEVSRDEIPREGLRVQTKLFIAGPDIAELVTTNPVDGLDVKAVNLLMGGREILDVASFADLSVFADADAIIQSRSSFLERFPSFAAGITDDEVRLATGSYRFAETVIIPEGLRVVVEPGVLIELDSDVSFVSYSPMTMPGTSARPIVIRPTPGEENFGVFAMIGSIGNTDSIEIKWVDVSGGSEATINGAFLSGMFSVYRFGRTVITNSVFRDAAADDALNIKYSDVLVRGNQFLNNAADAIDGDFVAGTFEDNYFSANGNDSLDFSGSDVTVRYNRVSNSGDKCVSIGEASQVLVTRNVFEACEIGVEVKDASDANVLENVIVGARSWAINAYVKKYFFGAPSFAVTDNVLLDNAATYGGLASTIDSEANITQGDLADLEQEVPWLAETLSSVPTR